MGQDKVIVRSVRTYDGLGYWEMVIVTIDGKRLGHYTNVVKSIVVDVALKFCDRNPTLKLEILRDSPFVRTDCPDGVCRGD